MSRSEDACKYFYDGYNCSTSVALAFKDVINKSTEEVVKDMMGFGGGMGHYRITCGAISGMVYILSNLYSENNTKLEHKQDVYNHVYPAIQKFEAFFGATDCKTLLSETNNTFKALERTEQYYKDRPCANIVSYASSILEEIINEEA